MTPTENKLTLWNIESELAELVDLREQMAQSGEDLTVLDASIKEYLGREVAKVDGVRGYLKHCAMMAAAAKAEAADQTARARVWEARGDRLKEMVGWIMRETGKTKLEGRSGTLSIRANGGNPPVEITQESLIPEECVIYEGRISGEAWLHLAKMVGGGWPEAPADWTLWAGRQDVQMQRTVLKGRVLEALKMGGCAGARLGERGTHVEVR